jgi:P-type Mg2+ transporter
MKSAKESKALPSHNKADSCNHGRFNSGASVLPHNYNHFVEHSHSFNVASSIVNPSAENVAQTTLIKELFAIAHVGPDEVVGNLKSRLPGGLSDKEASARFKAYGPNIIAREKRQSKLMRFLNNVKNPLVALLIVLAAVSFITGDMRATIVILIMVVVSVVLRFYQELRADNAAVRLRAMVSNTATVVRNGKEKEVALKMLVPGDIIQLTAGDMTPADVRILAAKDLFVNQVALTGEALPVEKKAVLELHDGVFGGASHNPFELSNICFMGSNIESGSATAIVVHTGDRTYFGALAAKIVGERMLTSFDKGINRFTWLMIGFIAVMVPAVFLISGLCQHNWFESFLFALAVAVGLTPEMLPMIVTVNLSKGALAMARKKVIVKRLNSIQNFGAMDVLCTDKTGTLTQGKIILEKHMAVDGTSSEKVLHYGYINSYYHTGRKNLLDEAVREHAELEERLNTKNHYRKVDEIPFDFVRRRMSVVVEDTAEKRLLICKGATEEVIALCSQVEINNKVLSMSGEHAAKTKQIVHELNQDGFRVVAVAYKMVPDGSSSSVYTVKDEADLTLLGFLAFLDPPKHTAAEALGRLRHLNVDVKILTGDNEIVTAYICKQVGIPLELEHIVLGAQIENMSDAELVAAVNANSVFARLVPMHKERIIRALQKSGHVTGFLGDGINDAPALKAADVGISVNGAADIAKESSDIILLSSSLLILALGVTEGRRVFGNIIKYIKMAASSNFGNMFSVVGASAFLPFLPMLPIQVLANNLLYDFSQTAIPTDAVDTEWLTKPRQWTIDKIEHFILFIGPVSSIFDYVTFFVMLYVFNCWTNPELFHTGWFVESLFTQALIIHVIRTNKIPFIESRASWPLTLASVIIVLVGAWLTVSPFAGALGLVPLPPMFWVILFGILVVYVFLTQIVKNWFIRKFGD